MFRLSQLRKNLDALTAQVPARAASIVRFSPDPEYGLTEEQAAQRYEEGYVNDTADQPSKSVRDILKGNLLTYFNIIFLIITIFLITAGAFRDLTFLPIIIANTLIGIAQEIHAKNTLDKLTILHAPKAIVVREGVSRLVPADELVLDDIVIFKNGKQVCADAVVERGEIRVNESLLTGEEDEIVKGPGDRLLSGSFVTAGQCLARLTRVGQDSYIYKLSAEARTMKTTEQSEIMRSLNHLLRIIGILIIPIGIGLFLKSYLNGSGYPTSISTTVAAVIGMIPEGLYLLTSIALAVSTVILAQKKVLVHDMKCIETLARVDVLCVDKTGTITQPNMSVSGAWPLDGYNTAGEASLEEILGGIVHAFPRDNETLTALQSYFPATLKQEAKNIIPFSSATKYSAAELPGGWYVYGAPEFILRDQLETYRGQIEALAGEGHRVVVFARCSSPVTAGQPLTGSVTAIGLAAITNPVRENAAETFAYFREQGVAIKVISGDNPLTVSRVAQEAGIENADRYIDAAALTNYTMLKEAVDKYTVFGRVVPAQKRDLIRALKEKNHTVAMTGDGVNDVLALREADCSVAMASGSDAAAHVSHLVLLDSDFARMPSVVAEGRRVINNIQRAASLFLVKNIFSLLMAVFTFFALVNYPLLPTHISLISMFTIGIPAFFLSQEPNHEMVRGHFISNVLLAALPAGLTNFFVVAAMAVFSNVFDVSAADVSSASTLLLATVGFMILYRIMRPMTRFHIALLVGCIASFLACMYFMRGLFAISAISPRCAMLLVVFAILTEPMLRYLSLLVNRLRGVFSSWQKNLHRLSHRMKMWR